MFYNIILYTIFSFFFFFNDTATTEIYTLSLHDALPIWGRGRGRGVSHGSTLQARLLLWRQRVPEGLHGLLQPVRSEEHTSELQSQSNLVCRLLLEKKKNNIKNNSKITYITNKKHIHQYT